MKKVIIILGIIFLIVVLVFIFINSSKSNKISIPSNQSIHNINGLIKSVEDDKILIIYGQATMDVKVNKDTQITSSNEQKLTISDLKEEQTVFIVSKADIRKAGSSFEAKSITVAVQNNVTGTISSINNDSLTVTVSLPTFLEGEEYQFLVTNNTPISASIPEDKQNPFSGKISLTDLKVGMKVNILENGDIPTTKDLKAQFINVIL